jgi:hypothetical protein
MHMLMHVLIPLVVLCTVSIGSKWIAAIQQRKRWAMAVLVAAWGIILLPAFATVVLLVILACWWFSGRL